MKMIFLHALGPLFYSVLIGALLGAALGYYGECTSGTCPLTSTWWRGALYGGVIGLWFGASSASKNLSRGQNEGPSRQAAEPRERPDPADPD